MTKRIFWLLLVALTTLTVASCDLESPTCNPDETLCTDKTYSKCLASGSGWDEIVCGSASNPLPFCHVEHICVACNDDSDCPEDKRNCIDHVCKLPSVKGCADGEVRCKNSKLYTCEKKAWENAEVCPDGCNIRGTACLSADEKCEDNTMQCTDDGKLATCKYNSWKISDCSAGQVCPSDKTACEDKVCKEDELVCNSAKNASILCINNTLVETACVGEAPLCVAGECVACIIGEKRCENNAVEICTGSAWKLEAACGEKSCNDVSHSCVTLECEAAWQRCNGNIVEQCNAAGAYAVSPSDACATGTSCLEDVGTHTVRCVECKTNANCEGVEGKPVCHSDKTCVACATGDKKCHSDNTLLVCDENGAWPTEGVGCNAGQECIAAASGCTAILGYCTANSDCKNPFFPKCTPVKNRCECEVNQTSCKIEAGQAKHSKCFIGGWADYSPCLAQTPVCNAAATACAECAKDGDCKDGNKCDIVAGRCKASPACTNNDIVCDSKRALTCVIDKWVAQTCSNSCIAHMGCVDCVPPTKKCDTNKLLTCEASGFWGAGVACVAGQECLDGKTACTPIPVEPCVDGVTPDKCVGNTWMTCVGTTWMDEACAGKTPVCSATKGCLECVGSGDCKDAAKTICNLDTNTCVACTSGAFKCENDSALVGLFQMCTANAWGAKMPCASNASCTNATTCGACQNGKNRCLDANTKQSCVNAAWGSGITCATGCNPTTNLCNLAPKPSTITWCKSQSINTTTKVSYGRMLDSRTTSDPSTITAKLLCGKAGQSLSAYKVIDGTYNPECPDCYMNLEFSGSLASLNAGEYLCMWAFGIASEMPVACQTDGTVVKDFNTVPTSSTALNYITTELLWAYLVDFENFTPNTSSSNTQSLISGGLTVSVVGAIHDSGSGSYEGKSLVISDDRDGSVTIEIAAASAYVGTLEFKFKGWEAEEFSEAPYKHTLDFYREDSPTANGSLELKNIAGSTYTGKFFVNDNIKKFTLKKSKKSGNEKPRLILDNIRWTATP